MTDLTHWHVADKVTPPAHAEPPKCCKVQFLTVAERSAEIYATQQADAVRAERVRIVTEALAAIDAYTSAASSLLDDPRQQAMAETVAERCAQAIRNVGCICPQVEVTRFGDTKPRYVAGRDHRCGLHDEAKTTKES